MVRKTDMKVIAEFNNICHFKAYDSIAYKMNLIENTLAL